jgi:hypothetical protein
MQEQRLALPKLVEKALREAEEKKMMSLSTSMVCQRESIVGNCVFAGGQLVSAIDFSKEYPPVSTEAMERAAAKSANWLWTQQVLSRMSRERSGYRLWSSRR